MSEKINAFPADKKRVFSGLDRIIKAIRKFFRYIPFRLPFWVMTAGLVVLISWYSSAAYRQAGNPQFINLLLLFLIAAVGAVLLITSVTFFIYFLRTRQRLFDSDATYVFLPRRIYYNHQADIVTGVPLKRKSFFVRLQAGFEINGKWETVPMHLFSLRRGELDMGEYNQGLPANLLGGLARLRHIRQGRYEISRSRLYFGDLLGLYRYVYEEKEENLVFFVLNQEESAAKFRVLPQADILEKESEKKLKMPGEFLEFKKYNPASDSPRFILWKIYARTGELLVRKQEMENPNSARLPFFVNFYLGWSEYLYSSVLPDLLDEYKSFALKVARVFREQQYTLDYFPEAVLPFREKDDAVAAEKFFADFRDFREGRKMEALIVSHDWQNSYDLSRQLQVLRPQLTAYRDMPGSAVVVTHSLDTSWLEIYRGKQGIHSPAVFFLRLSKEFFAPDKRSLWRKILFAGEEKRGWRSRTPLSYLRYLPLVRQIVRNEQFIEKRAAELKIRLIEAE